MKSVLKTKETWASFKVKGKVMAYIQEPTGSGENMKKKKN